MKAFDIMTTRVATIRPDAPIAEAIRVMLQKRISGLPVVDAEERLIGIVTEGDFMRRSETSTERLRPRWLEFILGPHRLADEYVRTHARKVEDVMTRNVATVDDVTPIDRIVRLMEERRVKRLPVLREGKVAGMISRADLMRVLARLTAKSATVADHGFAADAKIRRAILAEMDKQLWAPRASVNIEVRDGVVQLLGVIWDEKDRQALRVLAENAPGVAKVEDHLEYAPPIPDMFI
jgi:CBS domain-containing protein